MTEGELPHEFDDWLLLANMEEGQVAEKPKRQRAKRDTATVKGRGIMPAGKWIVCQYCGNTSEKALVPHTVVKGVAFDTLPCGLAWIDANGGEQAATLRDAFCKLYGQPPNLALSAPPTTGLMQFGGALTAEQWLPNAELWQQLTQQHGVTLDALPSGKSKGKKVAAGAVTFEVGMYFVPIKGAPKAVNAVDGAPKKTGDLTPIGVLRKFNKWATANESYAVHHFDTERYSVTALDSTVADPAHLNNTATQLAGSSVYGPAIALFTRKASVKV